MKRKVFGNILVYIHRHEKLNEEKMNNAKDKISITHQTTILFSLK